MGLDCLNSETTSHIVASELEMLIVIIITEFIEFKSQESQVRQLLIFLVCNALDIRLVIIM